MRGLIVVIAVSLWACGQRTYLVVRSTAKVELDAEYGGGAVKPVPRFRKDDGEIRIPCESKYGVGSQWLSLAELSKWIQSLQSSEVFGDKDYALEVTCAWSRSSSTFVGSTPAPGGRHDWYRIGLEQEYKDILRTPLSNIARVKRAKRYGHGLGLFGIFAGGASTIMSGIVYAFPSCAPEECDDVRASYAPWLITSLVVTGLGVVSLLLDWEIEQSLGASARASGSSQ